MGNMPHIWYSLSTHDETHISILKAVRNPTAGKAVKLKIVCWRMWGGIRGKAFWKWGPQRASCETPLICTSLLFLCLIFCPFLMFYILIIAIVRPELTKDVKFQLDSFQKRKILELMKWWQDLLWLKFKSLLRVLRVKMLTNILPYNISRYVFITSKAGLL